MRYSLWTWQSLYREGGNFTQNSHKADWTDCSIFLELQICISPGFPFFSSRTWQPSWEGAVMVKPGLNRERWTSLWLASFPDIQHTHLPLHCHEQTTNTVQYIVGQIFNTYTMYMKCPPSTWIEGRKKYFYIIIILAGGQRTERVSREASIQLAVGTSGKRRHLNIQRLIFFKVNFRICQQFCGRKWFSWQFDDHLLWILIPCFC